MKHKYIFGFLLCILCLCLYLFHIIYSDAKENAIADLNSRQMIHAKQAKGGIEDFFTNIITFLTKLSESDNIVDFDHQGIKELDFALAIQPEGIRAITRVDVFGKIAYTTPLNKSVIGRDISDQNHVREIFKTHRAVVSDVFTAVQGYRAIALHVPVLKGNEFHGTLAVLIDFPTISKRFLQEIRVLETGYAWMTSREGIELYCPVPGHTGKSVFENRKEFPRILSMANEMVKGRQGVTTYKFGQAKDKQLDLVKKHAVYLPIKIVDSFWTIVVATSEDEVLAALVSFKNKLIIIVGLFLFCSAIFSYYGMKAWGIVRESEERKKVEYALRESEEKYRIIFENSVVGIFQSTPAGHFISVNPAFAKMLGYMSPEELIENSSEIATQSYFDAKDRHRYQKILQETGIVENFKFRAKRKDGSQIWVSESARAYFNEDGKVINYEGIVADINEQVQAEQEKEKLQLQLLQTQKIESIGTLAGGIAHDFNNILSAIIGYTELAISYVEKGSLLEDNLQEVFKAGKRARDLVKQILAFARQADEELKPIQVSTTAKEALKLIRSTIPTTIKIKQNIESDSLVMGNLTQINQIFMNLCTNAAYAMEEGGGILEVGIVDVELNNNSPLVKSGLKPGYYMLITISDTGTGINPDILDSIFEPYFTTKGVGEGTGMGLAIIHGIIEGYSGKIAVESKLGKGTVFSIYLPLTKKRDPYRFYQEKNLPSGTEHILFVDDELSIAKMGSQILEQLGYHVTVRTSSVEALELFRSKPSDFDLIITDMTMPNMTGDVLAVELMKIRSDIAVVLCTGYSRNISEERAKELGIKAFAYKPVVKADLAKVVRKVIDGTKR